MWGVDKKTIVWMISSEVSMKSDKRDRMTGRLSYKETEDPFRSSQVIDAPGLNEVKAAP